MRRNSEPASVRLGVRKIKHPCDVGRKGIFFVSVTVIRIPKLNRSSREPSNTVK